jgi:amino acid transporter
VMDLALVLLMTILNLRGVRESGTIFALPTYFFIVSAGLLIIVGLLKAYVFLHQPLIAQFTPVTQAVEPLSVFLILRSFATGCTAMTGVEAISNGIPIFRKPETRNAATTLTWMAIILGSLFLGITLLTLTYGVEANPAGNPTVIAQLGQHVFNGPLSVLFPLFQLSVLGILTLSAETSYADFPRLASLLARDRFLPTQFSFRGDRLAFSMGIIVLAILAGFLLVIFGGKTDALINLFAVGVFVAFTLSQAGMVVHWWRLRKERRGWLRSMIINATGACTTALVTLVVASMKFLDGAWMVVLLIPVMVLLFLGIRRHYLRFERERTADLPVRPQDMHHRLIVPIDRLDRATIQSLAYARSISPHVTAVHVVVDEERVGQLRADWNKWQKQIGEEEETHLLIIESPYRSLLRPLLAYIDLTHERHPHDILTVILAEFVLPHWWEYFLHNHTALRLKAALLFRPGVAVLNLPQHRSDRDRSLPFSEGKGTPQT